MQMKGMYNLGCQSLKWNIKLCSVANNIAPEGGTEERQMKKGEHKWKQCGIKARLACTYEAVIIGGTLTVCKKWDHAANWHVSIHIFIFILGV